MSDSLPSGWTRVKLGDVALERTERENDPATSAFDRFVGSNHIARYELTLSNWGSTDDVSSAMKVFHPGDYLFVRRSLYASDFRERAARASFSGLCSGDILPLRERPRQIADGFLMAVLNHPAIWAFVVKHATGSITRRIKWKQLREYEFALPPLEEQRRIVELLRRAWDLDGGQTDALNAAEKLYESLSLAYFDGAAATSPLRPLPDVCDKLSVGIVVRPADHYTDSAEGIPALLMKNVQRGWLDLSDLNRITPEGHALHSKSALRAGDVVAVRSSGSKGRTGDAAVVPPELEGGNCIDLLHMRPSPDLVPGYLSAFLNSPTTRVRLLAGSSGTMQKHLNVGALKRVKIPLPTRSRQAEICHRLDEVDRAKSSIDARRVAGRDHIQRLLHDLWSNG